MKLPNILPRSLVLYSLVMAAAWSAAGQSALDGFSPSLDGMPWAVVVQPDGRILIGGEFTTVNGVARRNIARLHADGSVDTSFDPGTDATVRALALQPDGKILVGGQFTTLGGSNRVAIGRLNADGSLDTLFNPGAIYEPGPEGSVVYTLRLTGSGEILAGGQFTRLGGQPHPYLGRLHADGTADA
ncbi:MAG TPA: delta-60 repeat domain-containing protein, partial [Candidatus Saccharimonadales bacterium]|nr:delta-60 repeat domain-containing protein [Candidatus Saccharimonadales bacterium]